MRGENTSKQLTCQKFIFKIHSSRLRKNKWKLTLPLDQARKNDEVISLADSQVLRWIDELNGIYDADAQAKEIKKSIRLLRREQDSATNRKRMRQLFAELDRLQFKPDYLCLIIDKEKDYYAACKGFSVNGIEYQRLLGTNGGIKNETIVFVSKRLAPELKRRIENGRNPNKEFVPAKLEAYKALTCSASIPVSLPRGILVVNDYNTKFTDDIIYLDDELSGEPVMEERNEVTIEMDASDGYGLMLPSLAERWSNEMELGYVTCGVNTRFSFEKGMIFTFDFRDFADKIAHKNVVVDAWGNAVDINNVELILTTSMLKLWDSYDSCEDYVNNCLSNGYTFGITKTCPERLENERSLNYQFIQSYELSDADIDELIAPTVNEIFDVLGGDYYKTILFLKGVGLNDTVVNKLEDDYIKALMIQRSLIDDPYVQNSIFQLIKNRINQAKVGVLKVHGNYSVISGDPYGLCESIFGMEVHGLLKAGELYNKYWIDAGAKKLACFRAPMTCHNNIRALSPSYSEDAAYWYRYMNTCTVLNSWDLVTQALNGADYDGDIVMLTDNDVLVRRLVDLPTIMCVQRKAKKKVVVEEDFVKSNIESFGDDIGKTTNWITSMYEVKSRFSRCSDEYKILEYRIRCGQLLQQNCIDKAKGIISKPMPKSWHDKHAIDKEWEPEKIRLYERIVADKKPYFMKYIYPALMRQYNSYITNTNKKCLRKFQLTLDELMNISYGKLSDEQREFLKYYQSKMPVGMGDCVMNKICRKIEAMFDGYLGKHNKKANFDYNVLRGDAEYTKHQYTTVLNLYEAYNKRLRSYAIFSSYERVDEYEMKDRISDMNDEFMAECSKVCPNKEALCNLVLDICYNRSSTKKFAWDMCGSEIIHNLINKNGNVVKYPQICSDGEITYGGLRFTEAECELEERIEYCTE